MVRARRIRRGINIADRTAEMRKSARVEDQGKDKWLRRFEEGSRYWSYYMELMSPYIGYIQAHPGLSPAQKQVAMKEFFRRWKLGLPMFLSACAAGATRAAFRVVTPIPLAAPRT